jgi:hypothetical protein
VADSGTLRIVQVQIVLHDSGGDRHRNPFLN